MYLAKPWIAVLHPQQATRWDNYLHIFDPRIHWFSLINSVVIVIFLCVMVAMILLRTVSRDVCPPQIEHTNDTNGGARFLVIMPLISALVPWRLT